MTASYFYCAYALSPLRKEHSDTSEIVSQLVFGEIVELIEEKDQWRKVRSFLDNYEGWTDFKLLNPLTQKEVTRWLDGQTIEHNYIREIEGPNGKFHVLKGSFRTIEDVNTFNIGNNVYSYFKNDTIEKPISPSEFALSFLNSPYLWGGKSAVGIDCSGLTQTAFRLFDIKLPRDAYEQEELGIEIPFGEHQKDDLVFFINANNKIHHVGILISENELVHAHGFVRIDDFTADGIVQKHTRILSHKLYSIKRV
jgi:gamma-D-glutamyl-L-lysine dipeptidyl-peptidase